MSENYRIREVPGSFETVSSELPEGWVYADPEPAVLFIPGSLEYEERKSPDAAGSRRDWKDWEHYKIASGQIPAMQTRVIRRVWWPEVDHDVMCSSPSAFYSGQYGEVGRFNSGLPAFATSVDSGFIITPEKIDELRSRALNALLPTVKPEMSLINSIIELKDFKSLPRTIKGIKDLGLGGTGSLKSLLIVRAKQIVPSLSFSKNLKWVILNGAKVLADVYLQQMFNIRPLLSDIVALQAAVSVAEKRLRRIINDAGRPVTAHWSCNIQEYANSSEATEPIVTTNMKNVYCNFWTHSWVKWLRFVYYEPTWFHAEIQMSWTLSEFQRAHARLLTLLDVVGINFNPVIVWNALKWSFVADWVLGINTYLNSLRIGNMDPVINIHRFLFTFRRRRRILVQRESGGWNADGSVRARETVACPMVTEMAYRRSCGLPDIASLRTSGLSSTEVTLGSALGVSLVHSRLRHRR